jgi:hypothetical protein
MKIQILSLAFIVTAIIFSCKKSTLTTYDCTGVAPTYTTNIKAIIDASCASSGCHSNASKAKGIDLSSLGVVKTAAANANFMGSIQHLSSYEAMPKGASKLSETDIKLISCWMANGMPN